MKTTATLSLIALLLISCSKDDDNSTPGISEPAELNLGNLKTGQKSTYIKYHDVCGLGDGFTFTGDTLEVEIINMDNKLYFKESFTDGSTNQGGMEPLIHRVIPHQNYILIPERLNSSLFYFYGNDTIFTNPDHDVNLSQDLCFVTHENGDPFIGEEIGKINSFSIGSISTGENTIVSCVPAFLNLQAYLIYDETELKISHTVAAEWTSYSVNGFALLK